MSTKTKITAVALVALTLGATAVATTSDAQAHGWGAGLGFGIAAGLLAAGAYSSGYGYQPYYGYRHCHYVPQYDYYGNFIGNAQVCG